MRSIPLLVLALACGGEPAPAAPSTPPSEPEAPVTRDGASPPPESWVTARVEASIARMESSEAGRLVAQSIEAHGGLEAWLSKGTIAFDFDYHPVAQPERRMRSYQQVDLWSARARHEERGVTAETPTGGPTVTEGAVNAPLATFGWDGTEAWIAPEASAFPSTARFWSLTPYFFVGMPFVAADPGTRYERLEDAALDGVTYQLVKLTYEAGTGDAPDDYYVLYLHPETHRLAALRYVVSYPGFFTPGNHSPEKIMRYTEPSTVDGLTFATRLDTYAWSEEGQGEKVTEIVVSEVSLAESWPDAIFARPAEAQAAELVPRSE